MKPCWDWRQDAPSFLAGYFCVIDKGCIIDEKGQGAYFPGPNRQSVK